MPSRFRIGAPGELRDKREWAFNDAYLSLGKRGLACRDQPDRNAGGQRTPDMGKCALNEDDPARREQVSFLLVQNLQELDIDVQVVGQKIRRSADRERLAA